MNTGLWRNQHIVDSAHPWTGRSDMAAAIDPSLRRRAACWRKLQKHCADRLSKSGCHKAPWTLACTKWPVRRSSHSDLFGQPCASQGRKKRVCGHVHQYLHAHLFSLWHWQWSNSTRCFTQISWYFYRVWCSQSRVSKVADRFLKQYVAVVSEFGFVLRHISKIAGHFQVNQDAHILGLRDDPPVHVGTGASLKGRRLSLKQVRRDTRYRIFEPRRFRLLDWIHLFDASPSICSCFLQLAPLSYRWLYKQRGKHPLFVKELKRLGSTWSAHDCEFWLCECRKFWESKPSTHAPRQQ